ncbi:MAG: flagellar basal-body MS-ring/collar protein FliF [Myxococcales bacterium]|nr:flagellar basal-body MS-ring/collar protein FliF [Myxococcales bacterium]
MADSSIEAPGLGERLAPLRGRWEALSANQRVGSILALAVLVGVGATLWGTRGEEEMTVLFSNLSRDDSARVAQRLSEMGIRHRSEEEGTVILIPESVVHETRMSLAASGLPGSSGVGFEVFDEQRFGESEFSERVKYHRALEGELARTISHLAGVERARVHLVMPNRSLFTSDETPASASVVLHLRTGWQIRDDQAGGIVHLIASSVRGLDPGSVTLVDGDGRSIAGATESESEGAAGALDLRRQLERSKEEAVQALLDETLGAGRAVVRVAAEMSFTREERTEERYLPEESAARSFQIQEERDANATPTAAGVPGAASNLPGGAAPQTGTEGLGLARRSETRNFEISKTIRHAIEPVGRLTRMNVALVLDGTWTGEGEDRSFSPLPQEELDRIEAIVASAAGIDTNRGDQITVACVPFATSANLRAFDPRRAMSWPPTIATPRSRRSWGACWRRSSSSCC